MKKAYIFLIAIFLILVAGFIMFKTTGNTIMTTITIKLETTQGDIVIQLYKEMPITAGNFKKLVEQGFYDNTISTE